MVRRSSVGTPSAANGSSIAFLFEHNGTSLLLTGDAHASVLEDSIKRMLPRKGNDRLQVDVFKLPHHGSANNLTDSLLELIDPRRVVICTDGSLFHHPDETALALIRRHYPTVPILFTDDNAELRARAATCNGTLPPEQPLVISPVTEQPHVSPLSDVRGTADRSAKPSAGWADGRRPRPHSPRSRCRTLRCPGR